MIQLKKELCIQCGACASACSFGAIEIGSDSYPVILDTCVACENCVRECPVEALYSSAIHEEPSITSTARGFWVIAIEDDPTKLSKVSQELLSEARRLADQKKDCPVTLAIFAEQISDAWRSGAKNVGCDQLMLITGAGDYYNAEIYTTLLAEAIQTYNPEALLFPATADGRDFAPRVACRLKTGLTADCTGLDLNADGLLMQIRPTYGGSIMATILTPDHRPQMASIRPNVMRIRPVDSVRPLAEFRFETKGVKPISRATRISSEACLSAFGNLEEASVIIAGGYGLGSKENFEKIYRLCSKLNASAAATRKAVDEGWAPAEIQIGQTGKTVAPDIYIALGISGALQHSLGMKNAKKIIAVNNDPAAQIFSMSDVSILGDVNSVIDQLLAEF